MAGREKINKYREKLIFVWLALFPLGQIPKVLSGWQPMDILMMAILAMELAAGREKYPVWFRKFENFVYVCIFSLIFSLGYFNWREIGVGGLYLLRLVAYGYLAYLANCVVGRRKVIKARLFNSLMVVGLTVAGLGWGQYLLMPDLTGLKYFGWDDHYYRLSATFLDPAFAGIILVLTFVLVMFKYFESGRLRYLAGGVFLLETAAFTYSRASILSLVVVIMFWWIAMKKEVAAVLMAFLIIGVVLLPRPGGEGVKLSRESTVWARINNYRESLVIIGKVPVWGVGYNNLCVAKRVWLGENNRAGHSCSGLDNSILLILATTGVVGLMVIADAGYWLIKTTADDIYGRALVSAIIAVGVHGLFTNSYFYAWVMGWLAILTAISRREIKEKR